MREGARAWGLILAGAGAIAAIVATVVQPGPGMHDIWPWAGGMLAFPVGAVLVLLRARGNTIGRLLGFIAAAAALDFGFSWIAATFSQRPWSGYLEALTVPASVGIFAGILGVLHLFPTGRPIARWHRVFVSLMWVWLAAGALIGLAAPGPVGFSGRPNPFGFGPSWTASLFDGVAIGLPVFAVVGLVVLLLRRRRAGPVERAQLRWFFTGAAAFAPMMLVVVLAPQSSNQLVETGLKLFAMLAFWSLPAAIVVAIVRYHLYDIDRLVSRTVTYLVVAGVLSAVYAACIVALQAILPTGSSQLGVAASTLAAAALFAPLRTRVQQRLDRRFNRARYQANVVTARFARRLQQEIDLEAIESDLLHAVAQTMQPGAAQMWLHPAQSAPTRAQH